ncbi:MAG TPA: DUF3298 domain-containing protein [Candidatus Paceibacterota bacterium]|nr:DUF3298 domain-containing protein [Candidatus Paceibacterota bacterium]
MNTRKIELIAGGLLLIIIIGLTVWYMASHPAPAADAPGNGVVTDTPQTIDEATDYYTIEATYPTGLSFPASSRNDAGAEAEEEMKAWVDGAIAEFKSYADENVAAIADFEARGEEVPASLSGSMLSIQYEKKAGPRTVTYVFTSASYTGGAHGIEIPITFTFDSATGSRVALADLFTEGAPYLERLSSLARAGLPAMLGDYLNPDFVEDGTRPVAENFSTFYLEGDSLVFLFAPYQVAPYVVGTVKFPLPLTELADLLDPSYAP